MTTVQIISNIQIHQELKFKLSGPSTNAQLVFVVGLGESKMEFTVHCLVIIILIVAVINCKANREGREFVKDICAIVLEVNLLNLVLSKSVKLLIKSICLVSDFS